MKNPLVFHLLFFCGAVTALADVVKVCEETVCGIDIVQISDRTFETGWNCTTLTAPDRSGWIFTHWEISTVQAFENRDEWGRALDQASFIVYEDTTLTAHYLSATQDEDGDGLSDGYELYWYGNLSQGPTSDTDGDGKTFAEELATGTNPLMSESADAGPVVWVSGTEWLFNPNDYGAVTIRSEPEGLLFATSSEVYRPGTKGTTTAKGTFDPGKTTFAYWSFNGERQCDEWGRATDSMEYVTDGSPLTIVAYAASDYETRMKLYWYGTTEVAMTSDTDGDGKTFAEELAAGTNPLMAETKNEGPVKTTDGVLWQYNPYNYQPYTLKSDPEGALFPTESYYVRAGTKVVVSAPGSSFYGWQMNGGEIRRDEWGRSEDAFDFTMPGEAVTLVAKTASDYETRMKLYWYDVTDIAMTSDTDGDGKTFAEELAAGTNPLMAEAKDEGPVMWTDTETKEFNLQPYEQVTGAVVDEKYEVFPTFGGGVTPTVVDVDGDGKFDLVVEVEGGETVVFLGCGSDGNPEFRRAAWSGVWAAALAAAKPRSLAGLALDVQPPTDALSWSFGDADGDGVEDLLVSDSEGRIWYYKGTQPLNPSTSQPLNFVLQHKVWGGSFAGFANGLMLAAVDWDDDGDLDCLVGTAEGELMLLRDPKIGRPTNVKALAGVDNVLLKWNPNAQSRVRGYNVYRSEADADAYGRIASETPVPQYRDQPSSVRDYDYQVTSVSRFYVTGNSTPIVSESMPTDPVRAELGKVALRWGDATGFDNEEIAVSLGIENSLNVAGDGLTLAIVYDVATLLPVRVETSGLTEGVTFTQSAANGVWTVTATGGELAAGGGTLFTFVFEPKGVGEMSVSVQSATMKSVGGATIAVELPEKGAVVTVVTHAPDDPPADPPVVAPYGRGDLNGDGRLTKEDKQLLAMLMNGSPNKPKWDERQLAAGDYNGNGVLDQDDYQLLKNDFTAKGIK